MNCTVALSTPLRREDQTMSNSGRSQTAVLCDVMRHPIFQVEIVAEKQGLSAQMLLNRPNLIIGDTSNASDHMTWIVDGTEKFPWTFAAAEHFVRCCKEWKSLGHRESLGNRFPRIDSVWTLAVTDIPRHPTGFIELCTQIQPWWLLFGSWGMERFRWIVSEEEFWKFCEELAEMICAS